MCGSLIATRKTRGRLLLISANLHSFAISEALAARRTPHAHLRCCLSPCDPPRDPACPHDHASASPSGILLGFPQHVSASIVGRFHNGTQEKVNAAPLAVFAQEFGVDGFGSKYKYGRWYELAASVAGTVLGLLSGGGLCYNLAQFGELTTAFVDRTANQHELSTYLPLTTLFGGGRRLVNASHEENMAALEEDARATCIGCFVAIIISLVLCNTSIALLSWSAARQITRIRMLFLEAVMRQDMAWFDLDTEFNLASKMSENLMKLKEGMGDKLGVIANLVGTSVLCICQSLSFGWELTLACITVIPFAVAASVILSNYQTRSMAREMASYSRAGKHAEEVLKSVRTVVAFAGERIESDRYLALLQPAENAGRRRGLLTGVGTGVHWLLTYGMDGICLAYGARLVLADLDRPADHRKYVIGVLFSILFNVYMATQSVTFCAPLAEVFAAARGAAGSVFALLERRPAIDCLAAGGARPPRLAGDIRLHAVHFSYPSRPDVKILQGFSLHVKAGECVALVGSSGCGKSTVLQLVQRLYDPQRGEVQLDGRDVSALSLPWLRARLGVVGQEPVQKQRIAIARALLRAPAVLLLDEATSALDPRSERKVQAALDRASAGRTTLVVSHRLSTIVNADRIICMDRGAIVEQGTHKELLEAKGDCTPPSPSRVTLRHHTSVRSVSHSNTNMTMLRSETRSKLLTSSGFYYKLVTTSSDNREPDLIETGPEELAPAPAPAPAHTLLSARGEAEERASARSSACSAGSAALATLADIYDEDEEVRPLSEWQLLRLNAPEWAALVVGAAAAVVQGACFPVMAWLVGEAAGIFVLRERAEVLRRADLFAGMCVLVGAVAALAMFLQNATFTHSGLRLTNRLRHQYFSAILRQEVGFFDKASNRVGAVCARLSGDAAEVQAATGLRLGLVLQGVSSMLIGVVMAFCYGWKLTLVGLAILPLMFASIFLERLVSQSAQRLERAAMEDATAVATEAIVSIRTVQSLGGGSGGTWVWDVRSGMWTWDMGRGGVAGVERVFLQRFSEALGRAQAAVAPGMWWRGLVLGLDLYVPFMIFCSVMVYGAILVAREGFAYNNVMLVNGALMYGAYMLGQALVMAPGFDAARTCCARILAVVHREPKVKTEDGVKDDKNWVMIKIEARSGRGPFCVATGSFGIKDVEFSYPTRPHQRILKGVNLKVEAGQTVALVGSSGCGKSTILQLLQRYYDPDSGTIVSGKPNIDRTFPPSCPTAARGASRGMRGRVGVHVSGRPDVRVSG
ncbi:Multidrug resistance protein 1 [Papilio xuthus]|uniref:Multidrug resistance protein 1 n=1 Tax=Papilio xuthus TaxID=66420 RepID=A0A0N1I5L8_PAPXU|nr:Multidrug resistance protein 1 [Papilio xuthus]